MKRRSPPAPPRNGTSAPPWRRGRAATQTTPGGRHCARTRGCATADAEGIAPLSAARTPTSRAEQRWTRPSGARVPGPQRVLPRASPEPSGRPAASLPAKAVAQRAARSTATKSTRAGKHDGQQRKEISPAVSAHDEATGAPAERCLWCSHAGVARSQVAASGRRRAGLERHRLAQRPAKVYSWRSWRTLCGPPLL